LSGSKKVLILNKNAQERNFLCFLLKIEERGIFETSNPLEALRILQKEDIGLILVGSELNGLSRQDFKDLTEKLRPGVSVIFISPLPGKTEEFSINIEEFLKHVRDYLKHMGLADRKLLEMKKFSHSVVDRLLQVFSTNDRYFFNNNHLVSELSGKIAVRMGLDETLVEAIQMSALLRDLGKLMIHQEILQEKRRLTDFELTPMRAHPNYTLQILRQIRFPWNLDAIISQHHERYDGSGYPLGLKGREISVGARIICVADAYYAMTSDRPYRKAMPKHQALLDIRKNAGSQFDPEVTAIFLSIVQEEPLEMMRKKCVLILEREATIASMMKLVIPFQEMEIVHVINSIDAFGTIRQKEPQLIIADIEALGPEAFVKFHQTLERTFAPNAHFLIITPEESYMRDLPVNIDYILKPVDIEKLTEKVRSLTFDAPPPGHQDTASGLSGNIEDFDLSDIIQILGVGLKTAKIEIARGNEKGILYVVAGNVVYAAVGSLKGPEAFFELIGWKEGSFSIFHGQSPDEVNITSDTMSLLLEAASIKDKRNAVYEQHLEKFSKA